MFLFGKRSSNWPTQRKKVANLGWVGDMDAPEYLALHIKGVPHDF